VLFLVVFGSEQSLFPQFGKELKMKKLAILILALATFSMATTCFEISRSYINAVGQCQFEKNLYDNSGRLTKKKFACENGNVEVWLHDGSFELELNQGSEKVIYSISWASCGTQHFDELDVRYKTTNKPSSPLDVEYSYKILKLNIQK